MWETEASKGEDIWYQKCECERFCVYREYI